MADYDVSVGKEAGAGLDGRKTARWEGRNLCIVTSGQPQG